MRLLSPIHMFYASTNQMARIASIRVAERDSNHRYMKVLREKHTSNNLVMILQGNSRATLSLLLCFICLLHAFLFRTLLP